LSDEGASTALSEPDDESIATVERAGKDLFVGAVALTLHMTASVLSGTGRAFARGISEVSGAATSQSHIEFVENATKDDAESHKLTSQVEELFRDWRELRFESGMENDVSRLLWRLLMMNPTTLIESLATVIVAERASPRVAAEALRHLGRFAHPPSHQDRLWLLARALKSSSPMSRDGAGLGLAHLNDPSAIPDLKAAIEREPIESLRADLNQVLEDLQRSKDASTR
jgi:hypothetical protein